MSVEFNRRTKKELGLSSGVVLADELQLALGGLYRERFRRQGYSQKAVKKRASSAADNLVNFFSKNLGPNYCSFVDDDINHRHWYLTEEAVDLVLKAETRRDLALGYSSSYAYMIKESQFTAIKSALELIVSGKDKL